MKKMITAIVLWAAIMLNAQETTPQNQQLAGTLSNQLGVRFSNVTGYGISYQYSFLENYAIRTTAWFRYYEYILGAESAPLEKESDIDYNFGLDLQRNIILEDKYRVFVLGGIGYSVREKTNEDANQPQSTDNVDDNFFKAGLGVGAEYWFSKNLSADLGLSYTMNIEDGIKYKDNLQRYISKTNKYTGLGISIGLNFNF